MSAQESDRQFIVYACPTGELGEQLTQYFAQSLSLYGKNTAHKYMPHCTLTGFFEDNLHSIPLYTQALDRAYTEAKDNNISLDIEIVKLTFKENWHGLELQADVIKRLIANFAQIAHSSTGQEELRLKDWLHLSLAYNFNPEYTKKLQDLATEIIDFKSRVNWELRFYQKNPDWSWHLLQSWVLNST